MTYRHDSISSKWTKTEWLLKNTELNQYIPETVLFNKSRLLTMLSTHRTVFFKPVNSFGGTNIIRIQKRSDGFQAQHLSTTWTYPKLQPLFMKLAHFAKGKPYLLQQGINLARSNGKPFDIRVMVQKTPSGDWVCTGMFAKVGIKGKIVTNVHQGGSLGYFDKTLDGAGFHSETIRQLESQLKELGVRVGKQFDLHGDRFHELGLDVALDNSGQPWILEVNTRPSIGPLKDLSDRSLYRKLLTYRKEYKNKVRRKRP